MVVVKGEVGSRGGGRHCAPSCGLTSLTACSRSCPGWGCVHVEPNLYLTQELPQPSPDKVLFTELRAVISHYVSRVFLLVAATWTQSEVHDMKCSHQAFIHRTVEVALWRVCAYSPSCLQTVLFVSPKFCAKWFSEALGVIVSSETTL